MNVVREIDLFFNSDNTDSSDGPCMYDYTKTMYSYCATTIAA